MRCPKCHYLSFEPEPRCKNCGYGFSLADGEHDLSMRAGSASDEPLADLNLRPAPPSGPLKEIPAFAALVAEASTAFPQPTRVSPPPRPAPTTELPLFVKGMPAELPDEPLVKVPAEPRVPLAVRRKAPDTPAPRPRPEVSRKLGPLDRDLLDDLQRIEKLERQEQGELASRRGTDAADMASDRAGAGKRLGAAVVDAMLLGGVSAAVLWTTLRWCDIPVAHAATLPLLPTGAFLILVGVGYLLMFTAAGGQTLGKMAFGLRVVDEMTGEPTSRPVTITQALYRACLTVPSVLALGAGFIPALMGDERAVHDRIAHTRVVRA